MCECVCVCHSGMGVYCSWPIEALSSINGTRAWSTVRIEGRAGTFCFGVLDMSWTDG